MSPGKRDRRRSLRSPYVWHRWLGVVCAVIVLWLSATGIALNHTSALGLERARLSHAWLLWAYGMRPEAPTVGHQVAGTWISQAGGKLFFNSMPVADWQEAVVGVATHEGLILVTGKHEALLLTPEGQVVERLREGVLPDMPRPRQTKTAALPEALREQIVAMGGGLELTGARVLADLHSGRLFGSQGPLFMDLAAAGFIVLALTGLWLWWRFQRAQRHRERRQRAHHS
jgi:hypothetical protein